MSNFENEFVNRFKDQESLEGVDSAGIWNAVDAAMVADTTRGAAFYFTRGGLVLLAALMLLGGSCLYQKSASSNANSYTPNNSDFKLALASNTTPSISQNTPSDLHLPAQQEKSSNQNIAKANASTNNTQLFVQQQKLSGQTGAADNNYQTTKVSDQSTQTDGKHTVPNGSKTDYTKSNRTPARIHSRKVISEASDEKPEGGEKSRTETAAPKQSAEPEDKKPGFFTENSKELETNDLGETPTPPRKQQIQYMTLIKSQGIDNDQKRGMLACGGVVNYEKSSPFEAHFLLGINNSKILFNESGANRLYDTHFSDFGFSTKLGLTYLNKNKVRFGIGFGYQEWNTKFEESTSTPITVQLDDRIVGFTQDTSGTYTPVLGALTYSGVSNRYVLNHNKIKMISIPLEIGRQFPIRRTTIGFNVGLTYNLLLNQSGRTLHYSAHTIDLNHYSERDFNPFSKQVVTFHTNLFFDYAIREKLSLRLSPQVAFLGGQKRNTEINKFSMLNYGVDFGLVWDF